MRDEDPVLAAAAVTTFGRWYPRLHPWRPLPAILELLALSAFVVAQPVLDGLRRGSELLIYRNAGPREIYVTVAVVTLGIPVVLFVLEAAAGVLVSPRARAFVHQALIACLVAVFVLQLLQRMIGLPPLALMALGVVAVALAASAYSGLDPVRIWMRLASPAPAVFAALFLLMPPISSLLAPAASTVRGDDSAPGAPLVLMVVDELPLQTLLDDEGRIDARLYPNIAAFSEDATLFRNATGVAARTPYAIPAMLTGRLPREARAPVSSQYPGNLFTLLGRSHDLHVFESITALCAGDACPTNESGTTPQRSLLLDAASIWLKTLAPGEGKSSSWFRPSTVQWGQRSGRADDAWFLLDRIQADERRRFEAFLSSIDGRGTPFHFLHMVLPHAPWRLLPDGRHYDDRPLGMVDYEQRTSEPWPALVNHQRHILQTMAVDGLVGAAMARLKEVGLYDRATVLLTADHGVSFASAPPGVTRRLIPDNQHEVAWVPFLLKTPGQTSARVRDDNVMGVDVAPTLAAAAGVEIPWSVDGTSVLDAPREDTAKVWFNEPGEAIELDSAAFTKVLEGAPSRILDVGRDSRSPYVLREVSGLLDLPLPDAVRPVASGFTARLDDPRAYQRVGSSPDKVPALVTGQLVSESRAPPPLAVVAFVNGAVAGASRLYREADQPHRFALMVDPDLFRSGSNSVELFAVEDGPGVAHLRRIPVDGG